MKRIIIKILLAAVIISILAGVASAAGSKFLGKISGHEGKLIEVERLSDHTKWEGTVESNGNFEANNANNPGDSKDDDYKLREKGGNDIDQQHFNREDWTDKNNDGIKEIDWNEVPFIPSGDRPGTNIPEFPSIALPVAAVIGIMFLVGRRKKQE